jgi:BirA family biotin operon repressor/biotin-[acetyl-CoA-carboxylase] ligase
MTAAATDGCVRCDGWILHEIAVVNSTNLVAATLPAWEAVRADRQSAGRGRFQRSWVSDEGGLWLSAVVPTGLNPADWRALPLAVGLAVCDGLQSLGLKQFRLRWPNDVLVNERKLAGLLIDQFAPALAVAGIGINVFNQPEARNPLLRNQTARLADLVDPVPEVRDLARVILRHLRSVISQMQAREFPSLLPRINQLWGRPRRVELDLDGELQTGTFAGVGNAGELLLVDHYGHHSAYHAHQVRHLKEID